MTLKNQTECDPWLPPSLPHPTFPPPPLYSPFSPPLTPLPSLLPYSLYSLLFPPASSPYSSLSHFSLHPHLLTLGVLFALFVSLLLSSSHQLFPSLSQPLPHFPFPRILTPTFLVHSFLFPFSLLSLSTLTPLLLPINFLPFSGLPSLHTRPPSSSHEPVIGLQEVTDVLACVPDGKAEEALSR